MVHDPHDQTGQPTAGDGRTRGGDGRFIRTVEGVEKDAEAARLRGAGHNFDAIAERLGYANAGGAYKACMRALSAVPVEAANELRTLESERLDHLLLSLETAINDGDVKAITEARKISESRRRLHGLDGPVKVAVSVDGGVPEAYREQLEAARARVAAERALKAQEGGEDA
jgi:hypothetical protein